jgi:hypothetical protein
VADHRGLRPRGAPSGDRADDLRVLAVGELDDGVRHGSELREPVDLAANGRNLLDEPARARRVGHDQMKQPSRSLHGSKPVGLFHFPTSASR